MLFALLILIMCLYLLRLWPGCLPWLRCLIVLVSSLLFWFCLGSIYTSLVAYCGCCVSVVWLFC